MLASKAPSCTARQQASRPAAAARLGRGRVAQVVRASSAQDAAQEPHALSRRSLLSVAGVGAVATLMDLSVSTPAQADGEYQTFLGFDRPPTSYAGYGGNAKEPPRYTFEYPAGWKEEVPNKVEKGTQGIDGRVVNPRMKNQTAFLISLARAGEDNAQFKLRDVDSTLSGFAGADYDLQDALAISSDKKVSSREVNGQLLFDYDIDSPDFHYLATVTVSQGKVFALFVRSPSRAWPGNEAKLRHIIESFKLL